jgi:hypothetical protein
MIGTNLPLASNNIPNNLNMGNMVVGHVFLSSLSSNALNVIEDGN